MLKRTAIIIIGLSLLYTSLAFAQDPIVHMTTEVDENGKCINWAPLTVVWVDGTLTEADVPDHIPFDTDALQEWYVPITGIEWRAFTFEREARGTYFIRWSLDGKIFSTPSSVHIVPPGQGRHG